MDGDSEENVGAYEQELVDLQPSRFRQTNLQERRWCDQEWAPHKRTQGRTEDCDKPLQLTEAWPYNTTTVSVLISPAKKRSYVLHNGIQAEKLRLPFQWEIGGYLFPIVPMEDEETS